MDKKLVVIEWVDSHSNSGWKPLDELEGAGDLLYCRSVGWVVADTKEAITLVASISGENNNNIREFGTGDITIPKCCIIKTTRIK